MEAMNVESKKKTRVLIIGGGPAGLTAAIYTGRAGLSPVVCQGSVKGNLLPGGQLMTTTEVENYPGFPDGIDGPELIGKFQKQAETFGAIMVSHFVASVDTSVRPFIVTLENKDVYEADSVIIATGASAKWLNLKDEQKYVNNGISACATCDGPLRVFRNKHIFVVGGGDSAMEESLFLTKFASKVTVIHRRDTFRASKVMADRVINHEKIEVLWNSSIVEYQGDDYLTHLLIKNLVTGKEELFEAAGLFMAIGHNPNTEIFRESNLNLDKQGYVKVQNNVYTNIEGLFTSGDVHDTHWKQAVTAAGFGCMSAIAAERWLDEEDSKN